MSAAVAAQFVIDHVAPPTADGKWVHLLLASIDAGFIRAKVKAKPGAWAYNIVCHRHRLNSWDSPTDALALKSLLREARKAQSRQGLSMRKKTPSCLNLYKHSWSPAPMLFAASVTAPSSYRPGAAVNDGVQGGICKLALSPPTGYRHLAVYAGRHQKRYPRDSTRKTATWASN